MSSCSPCAYWASIAASSRFLCHLRPGHHPSTSPFTSYALSHCYDALAALCDESSRPLLPVIDPLSAWSFYSSGAGSTSVIGLQKALCGAMESKCRASLLTSLAPSSVIRLVSCSSGHAGNWITTIPSDHASVLPSPSFRLAARFRLGLPPVDKLPTACACGFSLAGDPWHFLSCKYMRGGAVTLRHNHVVQIIAAWVRRISGAAMVEPNHIRFSVRQRPDLNLIMGVDNMLVDVVVTHPGAPSYHSVAQEPLGTAKRAEKRKLKHYAAFAKESGFTVNPFALESFGGFGPSAQAVVKRIVHFASQSHSIWPTGVVRSGLCNAISIAIQRGNAHTVISGLQLALLRSHSSSRAIRRAG